MHCQPHDHTTNNAQEHGETVSEEQSLHALAALVVSGWRPVPIGHAAVLLYVRVWEEGSSDNLSVKGPQDACAERVNAHGQPVWRDRGSVVDVITRITQLPPPGTPGAPARILPPLGSGLL